MGKVAGKKPRDTTKIVVTIAGSVFLGLLLILALAIALGGLGGL
jgi:hypothetical protein